MLDKAPRHRVSRVDFGVYTSDEIVKLSVKEITNPQIFDSLQHATGGGLYDRALGPTERDDVCITCGLSLMLCPGHMGHIMLPLTVYNPVFFRQLFTLLKASCFKCKQLLVHTVKSHFLLKSLELLDSGLASAIDGLEDVYHSGLGIGPLDVKESGEERISVQFNKEQVIEELNAYVELAITEARRGTGDILVSDDRAIRHTISTRRSLIEEVQTCQFRREPRQCGHCCFPVRKMRAENYCKIFFGEAVSLRRLQNAQRGTREAEGEEAEIVDDELADYEEKDAEPSAGTKERTKRATHSGSDVPISLTNQDYLTPASAKEHMRQLWQNESSTLSRVFGMLAQLAHDDTQPCYPTDVFFVDVIPVPPTRFRPTMHLKGQQYANPQTASLNKVLSSCVAIRSTLKEIRDKEQKGDSTPGNKVMDAGKFQRASDKERLHAAWISLQVQVNCLYDSQLDRLSKDHSPGVKQILEKKEGLFRKHMMGKRVDYAARSVISPDPYIGVDEIGIPMVFAKKLTYPEPVTPFNVEELRQAVLNGPDVHPGATHVEMDSGKKILLSAADKTQREALAKSLLTQAATVDQLLIQPKKVHRHLRSGDVLLLNRQPTLHKPSIQAHRARVLPGEKTLRLHYACCKAYNADFDGDEMNAHFPQNEFGRSEAYNIVSVRNQYLVPKDGTPLAGLIQDHMVSGAWLTIRGRFFSRYDYQQLVYSALADKPSPVKLLPPSIIKPQVLWSGKQVLSTVLLNIIPKSKPPLNLHGKAKISSKTWQTSSGHEQAAPDDQLMCESEVIIRQGELLCGVLDKNHYGATPYSLVHCCYELYGGETSTRVLTCFAKLFTAFLQYRGFSLGIEDILVTKEADRKRHHVMRQGRKAGFAALAAALGRATSSDSSAGASAEDVAAHYRAAQFASDDAEMRAIDRALKGATDEIQNQITKVCMPLGLLKKFPHNNLQLMVLSGAKGSAVNCMQISCLLGQMELEGRRPPLMLSGRTLPSFLPYDPSPRAGGFIDARFLTGLKPQEYFFHCMAGREGLVDTAVKTSRSGYLQRCIIKHLEGVMVSYDLTVRDSDSSIIQFQYGEDGLEIGKTQFLKEKQFPFLIENQTVVLRDDELDQVKNAMDLKKAAKHIKKVSRSKRKGRPCGSRQAFPFLIYNNSEWPQTLAAVQPIADGHRAADAQKVISAYRSLGDDEISRLSELCQPAAPVMAALNPLRYFGSIPEKLSDIVAIYTQRNPQNLIVTEDGEAAVSRISAQRFRSLMNLRCLRSLVEPGEAVGLLAAQSIGEPSTQMTLNTFHFAGRGDMNVTLGIPRLREVLMVASGNIRTPTMEIPLRNPSSKRARRRAEALQRRLCRVTLREVIESVQIWESLDVMGPSEKRCRNFKIRFNFLPQSQYSERCGLTSQKLLQYFESTFIGNLREAMDIAIRVAQSSGLTSTAKVAKRQKAAKKDTEQVADAAENGEADDDADDQHDGDATSAKAHERHAEERDYDGEEEEMQELAVNDDADDMADDDADDEGIVSDEDKAATDDDGDEAKKPGVSEHGKHAQTPPKKVSQVDVKRVNAVITKFGILHYAYDAEQEEWAEVTFQFPLLGSKIDVGTTIQNVSRVAIVCHVPGIRRSFLSSPAGSDSRNQGHLSLHTDGVNIAEMLKYDDVLDLNRLYTNDIQAMLLNYGVEAAARAIIKECRDVFAAYGIDVDYRHLSLIADYMTYDGTYKPFNRIGIEANPSPLQKMSFETTMHFLKAATMEGASDDLNSPSSRLVTGRVVKGGTGCFDLMHDAELARSIATKCSGNLSR